MFISLTGFMGCGKSSVGRELATLLGCSAVDLDEVIERRNGRKIHQIFETEGEEGFRRRELEALREVLGTAVSGSSEVYSSKAGVASGTSGKSIAISGVDLILSLGGGTLTTPECAGLVHEKTVCIYLRAEINTLVENLEEDGVANRPMLSGVSAPKDGTCDGTGRRHESRREGTPLRERIEELMAARKDSYEKTAHHIIDIDGETPHETAEKIATILR